MPSNLPRSVLVSGARTPTGRLLGSLKDFSAADLGGVAIKAARQRAGISGGQTDFFDAAKLMTLDVASEVFLGEGASPEVDRHRSDAGRRAADQPGARAGDGVTSRPSPRTGGSS